jgi:hypothetical protein
MGQHKVNSFKDNSVFIVTHSYKKIKKVFKKLKKSKGNIVHIVGAPGTGKSANIYHALEETNLNIYEIDSNISSPNEHSQEVFCTLLNDLKKSLSVDSKLEVYDKLANYDAVLFADQFHDKHLIDSNKVGFSEWTRKAGFKSLRFYLICIKEYLKFYKQFQKINIIFQTAWRIRIKDKKYDLFTDFGIFSRAILFILGRLFCVVEVSYSNSETVNIVKSHLKDIDNEKMEECINKHGHRPRLILNDLQKK